MHIYLFCRKPAESSVNISSRLCENASCASLFTRLEACKKCTAGRQGRQNDYIYKVRVSKAHFYFNYEYNRSLFDVKSPSTAGIMNVDVWFEASSGYLLRFDIAICYEGFHNKSPL